MGERSTGEGWRQRNFCHRNNFMFVAPRTSECWQNAAGDHQSLRPGGTRQQGRPQLGQSKTFSLILCYSKTHRSYWEIAERCTYLFTVSNGSLLFMTFVMMHDLCMIMSEVIFRQVFSLILSISTVCILCAALFRNNNVCCLVYCIFGCSGSVLGVESCDPRGPLSINLMIHFCSRMYHLSSVYFITDRWHYYAIVLTYLTYVPTSDQISVTGIRHFM